MTFHASTNSEAGPGPARQALLTEIGEQPDMRHYDPPIARATVHRHRRFRAERCVTFSASGGVADNSPRQLLRSAGNDVPPCRLRPTTACRAARRQRELQLRTLLGLHDRVRRAQTSSPIRRATDSGYAETVNYFSIYVSPPKFGRIRRRGSPRLQLRRGFLFYTVARRSAASALELPNGQPLQQLHLDVRHRLSNRLALSLSYLYEPFPRV
jgi:hypothetical protein